MGKLTRLSIKSGKAVWTPPPRREEWSGFPDLDKCRFRVLKERQRKGLRHQVLLFEDLPSPQSKNSRPKDGLNSEERGGNPVGACN